MEPLATLSQTDHGRIADVAFSADGTRLASGNNDGTIKIWDSLHPAERRQVNQAATARTEEAATLVAELLDRASASVVADELWNDATLDPNLRRAALNELLRRCAGDGEDAGLPPATGDSP